MSDAVKGTALLIRRTTGEFLQVCACRDGEKPRIVTIPVAAEGAQDARNPWRYREDGETLHMTPSLKLSYADRELFHNGFHWDVKFQRFTPPADSADPYEAEWETFMKLNEEHVAAGWN